MLCYRKQDFLLCTASIKNKLSNCCPVILEEKKGQEKERRKFIGREDFSNT